MKKLFLSLINGVLYPYSLVAYGEDHTSTLFGIQTPSKNAFITNLFSCWYQPWIPEAPFLSWSQTAQTTDLPKSVAKLKEILVMATYFKKYLTLSPVIWATYEHLPKRGTPHQSFSGTAFFSTSLARHITTQSDHRQLFLMPNRDEIWMINGTPIRKCTIAVMGPKSSIRVSIEGCRGKTSYCFTY